VKASASVSSSQICHYFNNKDGLVRAVIDRQIEIVLEIQGSADLSSLSGARAWRDDLIAVARSNASGGFALASLGAQLTQSDDLARAQVGVGIGKWRNILSRQLEVVVGSLGVSNSLTPDRLAVTLLSTIQGALLQSQIDRDTQVLEAAMDTFLALAYRNQSLAPGPRGDCGNRSMRRDPRSSG
jgi:TetR/AcrR family transcriptional regulator, transcriptional repressor for nem operon